LPGFYSKDAILEAAFGSGTPGLGTFAFWMGIFAALLTSFYSWRLVFLTFFGKPRWASRSISSTRCTTITATAMATTHDDHAHGHA
jgi:NADH-quinone oxidoreductase subunit L